MPETVEFEIPSAEHSVAGMIDTFHRIAEGHAPLTPGLGKVIEPPPNIDILWKDIHLKKEQIYLNEYWLIGHRREAKGRIQTGTLEVSAPVMQNGTRKKGEKSLVYKNGKCHKSCPQGVKLCAHAIDCPPEHEERKVPACVPENCYKLCSKTKPAGSPAHIHDLPQSLIGPEHTHPIDNYYEDEIIYTDTLEPGDWVTVVPVEMEGEQLYMITAKMVKL